MTDKREDAVALSDDDLDDLVQSAEDDTTEDDLEAPESTATDASAPARAGTETGEPERPARSNAAKEGEDDEEETLPAETDDDDEEPAPPAADAPPALPEGAKPFQFKASGAERVLNGALELPDGSVHVPKAEVGRFRSTLASAVETQIRFQAYQRDTKRQLEALQKERNEKDVAADEISTLFAELEAMDEDQLIEWAQKFRADIPELKHAIREKQLDLRAKQLEAQARGPEPTPEEVQERRTKILSDELEATYKEVAALPAVKKWLTSDELNRIFAKHARRLDRLVSKAEADEPAIGVKKGQDVYDDTEVREDLNIAISLKKKAAGATPQARNDRLNADRGARPRGNVIPPSPRRAAPGAAAAVGNGKGKWDKKAFMRGELDTEDAE